MRQNSRPHRTRTAVTRLRRQVFRPRLSRMVSGLLLFLLAHPVLATPAKEAGETIHASAAIEAILPRALSPWDMFLHADILVQAVMLGLVIASVMTWTIWLTKSLELVLARRELRRMSSQLDGFHRLNEAGGKVTQGNTAIPRLLRAAVKETRLSAEVPGEGLKERVASRLERVETQAGRRMMRGTGILATIGTTAPFVGLLGTVWGIMHSFIGISQAQTTNLAVVAPGIAEALMATAIGLVAAIPAVVIYNAFSRAMADYRALLSDAATEVMCLVSREQDYVRRRDAGTE